MAAVACCILVALGFGSGLDASRLERICGRGFGCGMTEVEADDAVQLACRLCCQT